jgi:hypothetical protein
MPDSERITNKDLWELSDSIREMLKGIEEKQSHQIEIVCERITTLEVWKAGLTARLSVAVAGLSFIFTVIWTYVRSKFIDQQ